MPERTNKKEGRGRKRGDEDDGADKRFRARAGQRIKTRSRANSVGGPEAVVPLGGRGRAGRGEDRGRA